MGSCYIRCLPSSRIRIENHPLPSSIGKPELDGANGPIRELPAKKCGPKISQASGQMICSHPRPSSDICSHSPSQGTRSGEGTRRQTPLQKRTPFPPTRLRWIVQIIPFQNTLPTLRHVLTAFYFQVKANPKGKIHAGIKVIGKGAASTHTHMLCFPMHCGLIRPPIDWCLECWDTHRQDMIRLQISGGDMVPSQWPDCF